MYGRYYWLEAQSENTVLNLHFEEARKALLQPGIKVENTGSQINKFGTPVARLRVSFANATNQDVLIASYHISQLLEDEAFPRGFSEVRTALCLARAKAVDYAAAEHERKERECEENYQKLKQQIKSVLKRFLPF